MVDIRALIEQMERDLTFANLVNNPAAQFGAPTRRLIGAEILPEREVPENRYSEAGVRFRTIVANDGTRYSPVQKKRGMLTGSVEVALADQDAGSEFTASDYDTFMRLLSIAGNLSDKPAMDAQMNLLRFVDHGVNLPLREKQEVMRWQAIVDAEVVRQGDNGYLETISLSDPSGHRIASGDWDDSNYDPYDDIVGMVDFLAGKGQQCTRIIASTPVVNKLCNHVKIKQRMGILTIIGGTAVGMAGRVQLQQLNDFLAGDNIPPIEKYDLQYAKEVGTDYFLKRDVMVFLCATDLSETIDLGDDEPVVLQNTLGYTGVGRATGQNAPGRVIFVNPKTRSKPPRIELEAWQTSFPVPLRPEAIGVLHTIPI